MRKEANLDQWRKLYDIAKKIKDMEPWEHLSDIDLITIMIPNKEPAYCNVMGYSDAFYGIGTYIGYESINDFYRFFTVEEMPLLQARRYQEDNVFMCNFGSREDLTTKELKLIKDLGLKFRGKHNWIYFRSNKKGYIPYMMDQEEVLFQTEVFENLYMALKAYIVEGLEVNFDERYSLLRRYDPDNKIWINEQSIIKIPSKAYLTPVLEDEVLVGKLKRKRQINTNWEIDIAFINSIINDKEFERPVEGKICILSEQRANIVINQDMVDPLRDEINIIFNVLINPIMELGRPTKIIVRDNFMFCILRDLCDRIKVKLEIKEKLPSIDSFVEGFTNHIK